ncbi:MAG: glycosyltransferase family 4 protein [Bryobacteraceae bacterium]
MISYTSAVTIALDATPLALSSGGVSRYTQELARALAENYPYEQYWLLSDQVFRMPEPAIGNLHQGGGPRSPIERKWWTWGLNREMDRRGVQLFHGTDFSVPYLPQRPSVMTLHDLSPWLDPEWQPGSHRVRHRTPRMLRLGLASMVITPSESVRRAAIDRFKIAPDRIVTVPLAASEHFRPVATPPSETPYFLFVGTLEPRKNISRLIAAWREVRRANNVDLVLAGRTRADFSSPVGEPGLRLLGEVPDQDLPALYSGALACVYPSLYEGFGLPALEAMQCGALVIASRDPAIMEVTGGLAIHVDAENSHALAEAMEAIARSSDKFAGLRERALDRASSFSWRNTARLTREVYDAATRVFRK